MLCQNISISLNDQQTPLKTFILILLFNSMRLTNFLSLFCIKTLQDRVNS